MYKKEIINIIKLSQLFNMLMFGIEKKNQANYINIMEQKEYEILLSKSKNKLNKKLKYNRNKNRNLIN